MKQPEIAGRGLVSSLITHRMACDWLSQPVAWREMLIPLPGSAAWGGTIIGKPNLLIWV
jgi:hypothetical protein